MSVVTTYFCDGCRMQVTSGKTGPALHFLDVRVNCDRLGYGLGDAKTPAFAFSKELCHTCYERAGGGIEALKAALGELK